MLLFFLLPRIFLLNFTKLANEWKKKTQLLREEFCHHGKSDVPKISHFEI